MNINKLTELMLNGKQVRVTFRDKIEDDCDITGWWLQELWKYNRTTHMFECYYPISTYEDTFYTAFSEDDTDDWMDSYLTEKSLGDHGSIKYIQAEDNPDFDVTNGKTLIELAIEKIKTMEDDEIIRRIFR